MSSHRRMHDGSQPIHPKDVGVEASNDFRDRAEDITSILTNFTENATKVISGNDVFGESLHAQLEALRQSGQIRSGDRVKIGLVGASEMGKSSTVNALIHSRELCKTVTGSLPGQQEEIIVHVFFYAQQELADMLAEYVNDFCTFHFEKEDEAERTANEHARMQNSAETLVQLITALHLQGSVAQTEEQIKQDLESHYQQKSIARYKRTLVQQSSVLVNDFHGGSGNVKKYSFPDVESTIAFTHPLGSTDEPGSTGRSMWPLVKRIRIHIKDHVLLQDIVVGDAPGISDTNVARVNNSKAFLDSCDFLLVFSCIGVRIASDQTVADVLSEYGERFKDKLVMVITKGDEAIESRQMGRLLGQATGLGMFHAVSKYRAKDEEIKATKSRTRGRGITPLQRFELSERLRPLEQEKFEMGMEIRNTIFKIKLLKKKKLDIPIVFISNKHYWRHTDGDDDELESSRTLPLLATGIPTLRRILTSLPMKSAYRCLDEYLQRFISFADALKTVVEREPPKNPVLMKQLTDDLMDASSKMSLAKAFDHAVSLHAVGTLLANSAIYAKKAERVFDNLQNLFWATIKAIVNRRGVFLSKTTGLHDWPQMFNECAVTDIERVLKDVEEYEDRAVETYNRQIERMLAEFASRVSSYEHDLGVTDVALKEMIESCRRLIALRMEGFSRNYEKDIANVRLNATKSRHTNYFAQSLGPLFDDIAHESGTGYKLRVIGKCKDFVDAEDDNVITPSLKIFFDSLRAVKSEHAGSLDEGNHREFRFLCSNLTCTMEKGGAFDAAQKDGSRFLKKTTGKGVKLVERMMQELKDMIDTWVIVPEMTEITDMLIKIEDDLVEDEAAEMGVEQDVQGPPQVAPVAQMMSGGGLDGSMDMDQNTGAETGY